jgi:integrase
VRRGVGIEGLVPHGLRHTTASLAISAGANVKVAILTVTRRHFPAWMGAVLTICLLIPGPVDELAIAGMAAFK